MIRRLLIVSYEYPPLGGGGGVVFRDLAEELARRMEVTVLTSGRAGLVGREREGRVEVLRTPVLLRRASATASLPSMLSFFPSSLRAGARLLRERAYDVVHSSFAVPSGPSGLLLARRFGLPHVLSLHGGDVWDPSKRLSPHRTPGLKQTVRWVIRRSDRVAAQSSDTARRAAEIYHRRAMELVPLAVRPVSFEGRSRAELGLHPDRPLLVTVGRLVARKGLEELIDLVARLEGPPAQLVVVGAGPLRSDLEARVRARGLEGRVSFTGFVSEERKWQILALADLYVSATRHEGFGIVFLEAMASGLPVLTYDEGGQRDFVSEDVGALVPVGDAEALRRRIEEHLGDAALRRRKGEAGRKRAAEYTVERFAERYAEIYASCRRP